MRELYKDRLEASGLWNVSTEEQDEKLAKIRKPVSEAAATALGNQKVSTTYLYGDGLRTNIMDRYLKKPTEILIYSRTFSSRRNTSSEMSMYIICFSSFVLICYRPTALDTSVAAHILLLTLPSLPNDLLRTFISTNYPALYTHAQRIRSLLYPPSSSPSSSQSLSLSSFASEFDLQNMASSRPHPFVPLTIRISKPQNILSVLPPLTSFWRRPQSRNSAIEKTDEEKQFDRVRWGFYALAALSVIGWVLATGLRVSLVPINSDDSDAVEVVDVATEEEVEDDEEVVDDEEIDVEVDDDDVE